MRWAALLLLGSLAWADDRAIAALQRGDWAAAEKLLRAEVAARPADPMTLSLLGVSLDGQKRSAEAADFHRRAVAAAGGNPDVLSNFGNHLVQTGDDVGARSAYLSAVAAAPKHRNANLQLIRILLRQRQADEAAKYLANLGDAGDAAPRLAVGFADAGDFARAEDLFARALSAMPDDFNLLVNLGTVAGAAGHYVRAREAFAAALKQQPRNGEVLVRAAQVDLALGRQEDAVRKLVRVPEPRADVQRLIAMATSDLGALDDSLAAWDRYVKLAPQDDAGRRERGFTAVRMGQVERGVEDLKWYLERHPNDPAVHFQLGVAEEAVERFDRAIALKPDFASALSARGGLFYQQGKPEAALKDLEAAAKLAPNDALTLDRLGQTYAVLERPVDAVRALRRAVELAPADSKVVLHLARALEDAGQADDAKVAMERFKHLGPATKTGVPAGLVEYLAMTPEQQKADYRARVEKAYRDSPDDPTAQLHYLKLLLEDGKDASDLARRLKGSKVAAEAGRALVDARQWALAKELAHGEDLLIAELRLAANPMAVASRGPKTVEFLWHAAAVLGPRAAPLLDGDSREILLLKAAVTGSEEAAQEVRRRWPEWSAARRPLRELLERAPREW